MQKPLAVAALLLLVCASIGQAQKPPAAPEPACPTVDVTSPDLVTAGDALEITAAVTGGDQDVTPTYNWVVSDGAIESGQGTATIKVDTSAVASGFITATVEIGGYSRECMSTDSATTSVEAKADDEPAPDEPQKPPRN